MAQALLMLAVVAVTTAMPAAAEGPVSVRLVSIENGFPGPVTFRAEASSSVADIVAMRLRLAIASNGNNSTIRFPIDPASKVTTELQLPPRYPAGVDFRVSVEAEDARGNQSSTPEQPFWLADTRQTWQRIQEGPLTVHYYGNRLETARRVLAGARYSVAVAGGLLGTELAPFSVVLYEPPEDASGAQTSNQNVIGIRSVAYADYGLVHVVNRAGGSPEITARHETTHMLVRWTVRGVSRIPAWLNEGFAVWSEGVTQPFYRRRLEAWIQREDPPSLRTLIAFPTELEANSDGYVQGASVVQYLLDTYGHERLRTLFHSLGEGDEAALQLAYGLTVDGLDAAWRESLGLQPRSYETARPTPLPIAETTAPEPRDLVTTRAVTGSIKVDGWSLTVLAAPPIAIVVAVLYLRRRSRSQPEDS